MESKPLRHMDVMICESSLIEITVNLLAALTVAICLFLVGYECAHIAMKINESGNLKRLMPGTEQPDSNQADPEGVNQ